MAGWRHRPVNANLVAPGWWGAVRLKRKERKGRQDKEQILTYLKLSGLSLGLIINWNVICLRDGLQRVVRNHPEELTVGHG